MTNPTDKQIAEIRERHQRAVQRHSDRAIAMGIGQDKLLIDSAHFDRHTLLAALDERDARIEELEG